MGWIADVRGGNPPEWLVAWRASGNSGYMVEGTGPGYNRNKSLRCLAADLTHDELAGGVVPRAVLQDMVDAAEWVLHVESGVGKWGGEPEPNERRAALDSLKQALARYTKGGG